MIQKQMGNVDWNRPAVEIERLVRGLNPWPSAYTKLKGKTLKIWKAQVIEESGKDTALAPGTVIQADTQGFYVKTGQGILNITELQLEGKKRMDTPAFLRGYTVETGSVLL